MGFFFPNPSRHKGNGFPWAKAQGPSGILTRSGCRAFKATDRMLPLVPDLLLPQPLSQALPEPFLPG